MDHIRTLMEDENVSFTKLGDEEQVELAEAEIRRAKRRSADPATLWKASNSH